MNQHHKKRVVVLIDMDCFYVQVEQRRDPLIRGKPCAVVQYNAWKGGGIIAVGYEARAVGVSRNMRGDEAKQKCPEINLCRVPTANGKADLTRYRDASAEVIKVLLQFGGLVERASIDEAYVDFTETIDKMLEKSSRTFDSVPKMDDLQFTHVVGYPGVDTCDDSTDERSMGLQVYMQQLEGSGATNIADARLLIAAKIVEEMRQAVYDQTSFRCSAGISHNKMLAKLACGINKPNKQTILPMQSVAGLFETIKIGKIRNLGGKLGKSLMSTYGIKYIGELTKFPSNLLIEQFGAKTGLWLHEVCRGIDNEIVKERHLAESVGCSKNFTGAAALNTRTKVKHWIEQLAKELVERLVKERDLNNRLAKGMTAHVGLKGRRAVSRVCPLDRYDVGQVTNDCLSTIEQLNENSNKKSDVWTPAITMMGLSSKNFRPVNGNDLTTMVSKMKTCQKNTNVSSAPTFTVQNPNTIVSDTTESKETLDIGDCKDTGGVSRFFKSSTSNVINNNSLSTSNGNSKKRSSFEAFFTSPCDDGSSSQAKSSKIDHTEIQADKMFQRFKESSESKSKRKENEGKSTNSENKSERSRSFLSKFAFLNEINTSQQTTAKSQVTEASQLKVDKSNDRQRSVVEYNHSFNSLKKTTNNELAANFPKESKVVHHNKESPQMTDVDQKQLCKIDCARQRQKMKQQQNQSFPVTNGSNSKKMNIYQSSSNKSNIPAASSQDETFYHPPPAKDDIDMDVFDSLPLGIQHELRSALGMQSSQSSNKKSNSGQQQNSIQKFLTGGSFFKSSTSSTKSTFSQQPMNAKKQKPRGGNMPSKSQRSPGLPCGFFRARFQTSAAIKKAVEAQKLRSEKNDGKSKNDRETQENDFSLTLPFIFQWNFC